MTEWTESVTRSVGRRLVSDYGSEFQVSYPKRRKWFSHCSVFIGNRKRTIVWCQNLWPVLYDTGHERGKCPAVLDLIICCWSMSQHRVYDTLPFIWDYLALAPVRATFAMIWDCMVGTRWKSTDLEKRKGWWVWRILRSGMSGEAICFALWTQDTRCICNCCSASIVWQQEMVQVMIN